MKKQKTYDASVLLARFAKTELKMTPQNRLFIIHQKEVLWPYLVGPETKPMLRFAGNPNPLKLPPKAEARALAFLIKQRDIRKTHHLDFDPPASEYEYSGDVE